MQPPPFVLNCLGTPRLLTAGGQEVRIRVKKHLAVLVILAVDGGKVRRERLVSMLWPTARPDRARGSVATAISVLRAKLGGEAIEPGRDWVQLRRGWASLDLHRLATGDVIGDDFTQPLEVDAFLAGFEIDQVPDFEEWKGRQHARLLPAVEKALVTLAEHARISGDLNRLAALADRLLEINDLSEAGITARMQAYALSGDRITALRLYDDWVRRLDDELRAHPTRSVEDLANRLRGKGLVQSESRSHTTVHTEQWRNQHFIGRSREYRLLYDAWNETLAGTTQHVLITGDSGVGKTTLADRFATSVALEGCNVVRTRCFELETGIPFTLVGGIISSLLNSSGSATTSPHALAELARVVPEISKRFPGLPKTVDSTGEDARLRFVQAAAELLEAVLDERPVLIVIDDYDQADDISLGVLHLLARRLRSRPFLLVLTTRSGKVPTRPESVRARLGVEDLVLQRLEIEPLSTQESEALFLALVTELGLKPTAAERSALLRAAAGFPLAIELVVRDWQVHGTGSLAFAINAFTRELHAHPESRYQQLTQSVFADLNDTERLVVHMAAVLDRRVGEIGLYKIAGLGQVTILATLARMLERRVLRDGPTGLEWINPSVRAHAYLAVPPSIRRTLHEGVLDELVARTGVGSKVPGLELAWHSMRADKVQDASAFLLKGAREALLAGAAREAELALVSGMPAFDDIETLEANLCLAEIWVELGRTRDALELLRPIVGSEDRNATRATLLTMRGVIGLEEATATPDEMEPLADTLLAIAQSERDLSLRAQAVSLGVSLERGFLPARRSQEFMELGTSIPVEDLSPVDAVDLLSSLAKQYYFSRDIEPCELLLTRALRIAEEAGIRSRQYLNALNGLGAVACARGDYALALRLSKQHFDAAQFAGLDRLAAAGARNAGLCCLRLGDFREGLNWTQRLREFLSPIGIEAQLHELEIAGLCKARIGDRKEAGHCASLLVDIATNHECAIFQRRALLHAADIRMACDETRKAAEIARQAMAWDSPFIEDPAIVGRFARWVGSLSWTEEELVQWNSQLRAVATFPLDELDRVELLMTLQALNMATPAEEQDLEVRRARLPAATVALLETLTSLQPRRERGWGARAALPGSKRDQTLATATT